VQVLHYFCGMQTRHTPQKSLKLLLSLDSGIFFTVYFLRSCFSNRISSFVSTIDVRLANLIVYFRWLFPSSATKKQISLLNGFFAVFELYITNFTTHSASV
jgi:hypothetical protein